ncbi:E3 ubiquitin-protein ligase Topors [Phlebotomus papatasi]|uniref:E3 ubiquitin-protein ligase Topors n=1 Tax=Phlebotomus papatasi TaxID=29031 RepID=UPI0024836413|nr:E3 ubiquitin-protein ligase Topors [Phlebotomus papatasi]XP_055704076.1 E3 ubiquitin-protein ligase Topors [Phlebotomus papatasi]XP_055704077.1 E3 ubiquitin-protein ligase Topors [Phlebotomus papatasi]XP_055704078.1 E3 ubiquitin-protein ligase Topors [Phlebotomus papatasi]
MSSSMGIECPSTPEHLDLPPTPDRNDVQDLNSPSQASDQETEETPSSPPPNCAICLGQCRNKSFTDSCLHQFCFKCLLEWSKVKAECPLCKQAFKSIIHNVRSIDQFDEHLVHPQQSFLQRLDFLLSEPPRFRFSATLQVGPSENEAIQRFFAPTGNRFMQPYRFRQLVYTNHLYAEPLTDITGRYRECSARFYSDNPAQVHRLMPFIDREVRSLLGSEEQASSAVSLLLRILTQHDIISPGFRSRIRHLFGDNTDHFIHELFNFAQAPYDLIGYDNHVRYVGRNGATSASAEPRRPFHIPLSVSAPFDVDDNLRMAVPPSEVAPPPVAAQSSGQGSIARDARNSVIFQLGRNIEISSTSESDSDDCQFVLELKPPHLRTPELVSLNSESDSDVVFVDETRNSPKPQVPTTSEVVVAQEGSSRDAPAASSSSATQTALTTMPLIPKLRIKAFHTAQARICHSDDSEKEEVKPTTGVIVDEGTTSSSRSRFKTRRIRPTKRLSSSSSSSRTSETSSEGGSTSESSSSCEMPNRVFPLKKRKHTMSSSTTSSDSTSSLDESSHEEFMVTTKMRKKVKRFSRGDFGRKRIARKEDSTDDDIKAIRKSSKAGKRRKAEHRVYKRITKMRRARKIANSDD